MMETKVKAKPRLVRKWKPVPAPFAVASRWRDVEWHYTEKPVPLYRLTAKRYVESVGMTWTYTKEFSTFFIELPTHAQGVVVNEMKHALERAIREHRKWGP